MAHDIAQIGGKPAMMYADNPPWHNLGTKLDGPATSAEAIKAAGLDWHVEKVPLFVRTENEYETLIGRYATVRRGAGPKGESPALGIVGRGYVPLQNIKAFEWFDEIVGEKAAIYHTAGALGQGERVWLLAKLPEPIRVVGDDVADKYLLLSNSHDGSSSVQVKFTPIRVVCQNTLTMALSDGEGIRVHHTSSMQGRLKLAQVNLGIIQRRFEVIEEGFKGMQRTTMNAERLTEYVSAVFPEPKNEDNDTGVARIREARKGAMSLFEYGRGNSMAGTKGTLWAAYNGVTELVDFRLGPRTSADRRLESAWFGSGYSTKTRAYRIGLDYAKAWRN